MRATDLAHLLLDQVLRPGDWVVDATVGNGHDTLWLAERVGPAGRVFGFDVQVAALAAAAVRVQGLAQVELLHSGHERLAERLSPEAQGRLGAVMFNLGYLPGGAKQIVTRAETTIAGLSQALAFLAIGGRVTVMLYTGHPCGAEEVAAVRDHAQALPVDFAVTRCARLNATIAAPELIVIERVR